MSAQDTTPFPLPREHDRSHNLALPAPLDKPPTYVSSACYPATQAAAQFTLIGILESRIRTLTSDIHLLREHVRQLTVALDDSLDRESAHALCSQHERLAIPHQSATRPGPVAQVHDFLSVPRNHFHTDRFSAAMK
ncbi:hypothetical protein OG203_15970 [Nocardia sp. NBC_01499]|uniref:hypothetical protein n=1 Tax=Nocardia sp. NBC_01499 TaxID=2903597 RepID=UPI00386F3E01